MSRRVLYFTGPREIKVREEPVPEPGEGEVLVETDVSAISPGTELLVYRGEIPAGMAADATIDALDEEFEYPLQYGYAAVGRVAAVGAGVDDAWQDRRVFAFAPHASHFLAVPEELRGVPDGSAGRAALLANAEAAVNFVLDGAPAVGERVAVFGQGVVGLLTTALLAEFPLEALVTVDGHERRRELALEFGADASVAPGADDLRARLDGDRSGDDATDGSPPGDPPSGSGDAAERRGPGGADLAYELSGNPAALDGAIAATGFSGRLVVGSWYGTKPVELDLGGAFHRSRIRLLSSQVSSIDPTDRGRWDKARRLAEARRLLERVDAERLLTHRVPFERAPAAYRLLDECPEEAVGVLLTYS
jgi:alcohol dehydrogenase